MEDWTPEKDVIISSKWIAPSGGLAPEYRGRNNIRNRWANRPIKRQWFVEYADAATQGESHLFIQAAGLPKISREIRSADDMFGFAHIPSYGWYETRKAARAFRYHSQQSDTEDPSPPNTQNPLDTRSR